MNFAMFSTSRGWLLCILVPCIGVAQGCYLFHGDEGCGRDADLDGWPACDDCDDSDPAVSPGADEGGCCAPRDGKDNDCDGEIDEGGACELDVDCWDVDGDGWPAPEDCDDTDPSIHPGAPDGREPCFGGDGIDQDCDGTPDDEIPGPAGGAPMECDFDGDGWFAPEDCDDTDATVHPGAEDGVCCGPRDGKDNDCDGEVDEGDMCDVECALDLDGDGWFAPEDCDDSDPTIHPGAQDVGFACGWVGDGIDQDCDGVPDDEELDVDWCPDCAHDGGGVCIDADTDACENPCPDDLIRLDAVCEGSQVCCIPAPLEASCDDFGAECIPDDGLCRGENVVEQADCGEGTVCCKSCDGV